jgi:hypothetical protein
VEASSSPIPDDIEGAPDDDPTTPEAPEGAPKPADPWGVLPEKAPPTELPALVAAAPLEADPDATLPQAHRRTAAAEDAKRARTVIAVNGGSVTPAVRV